MIFWDVLVLGRAGAAAAACAHQKPKLYECNHSISRHSTHLMPPHKGEIQGFSRPNVAHHGYPVMAGRVWVYGEVIWGVKISMNKGTN